MIDELCRRLVTSVKQTEPCSRASGRITPGARAGLPSPEDRCGPPGASGPLHMDVGEPRRVVAARRTRAPIRASADSRRSDSVAGLPASTNVPGSVDSGECGSSKPETMALGRSRVIPSRTSFLASATLMKASPQHPGPKVAWPLRPYNFYSVQCDRDFGKSWLVPHYAGEGSPSHSA